MDSDMRVSSTVKRASLMLRPVCRTAVKESHVSSLRTLLCLLGENGIRTGSHERTSSAETRVKLSITWANWEIGGTTIFSRIGSPSEPITDGFGRDAV